jgi:hypothetical protein
MSDRGDDFERGLERDLREWTDATVRPSNWTDEARALTAAGQPPDRSSRSRLIALSAAAIVLIAAGTMALVNLVPGIANLVASPSSTAAPSGTVAPSRSPVLEPTPQTSTLAAAQLPLNELAWWTEGFYGYGYVEPPPSGASPLPEAFKLLRIGTLDGHISAEIRLNPDWSHSSVSGPVGTDVVVANDDRAQTSVFAVSATDGMQTNLFVTPDLVPAAILSWDGATVYYVKADRTSGADAGLWSRPRAGGPDTQLVPGPLGEPIGDPFGDVTVWWLTLSPDGKTLVVQWCRGGVACRTHLVDLATGDRREATGAGSPIGITDAAFVADGVPPHDTGLVAVDLSTGEVLTIVGSQNPAQVVRVGSEWLLAFGLRMSLIGLEPGDVPILSLPGGGTDRPGTSFDSLHDGFGVALPDGWILRWLDPSSIQPPAFTNGYLPGQLVNVVTGERLDLGPFSPLVGS